MTFHSSGVRLRAFFQDLIGHGDLAKVVKVAAAAQGDERFLIEPEVAAQGDSARRERRSQCPSV